MEKSQIRAHEALETGHSFPPNYVPAKFQNAARRSVVSRSTRSFPPRRRRLGASGMFALLRTSPCNQRSSSNARLACALRTEPLSRRRKTHPRRVTRPEPYRCKLRPGTDNRFAFDSAYGKRSARWAANSGNFRAERDLRTACRRVAKRGNHKNAFLA